MRTITKKSTYIKAIEEKLGGSIEEILRRKYVDENKQIHTISHELGITYLTTIRWLHKANITSRRIIFKESGE
jgi:hypothetical protein